jgi:hypothetical protein
MVITNQQEAEKFVLSYLENNQEFRQVVKKRFFPPKRKRKLELVDPETEQRIGEALAEIKAGNYVLVSNHDELDAYLDSIFKE